MSQIFLPNTRLSPYHAATQAAGATEYMVYNHMYLPLDYGRPPIGRLPRAARGRDAVGRGRRAAGADPGPRRRRVRQLPGHARHLGSPGRPLPVRAGRRRDRPRDLRPRAAATRSRTPSGSRTAASTCCCGPRASPSTPTTTCGSREADVAPLQLQGPNSRDVLRRLVGRRRRRPRLLRLHAGHDRRRADVIVSRTGWSGELGYEIFPLGSRGRSRGLGRDGGGRRAQRPGDHRPERAARDRVRDHRLPVLHQLRRQRARVQPAAGRSRQARVHRPRGPAAGSRPQGVRRRTIGLLGGPDRLPRLQWAWTVHRDGRQVGQLRWAAFSPTLERMVAVALIDSDHADPGHA